MNKNILALALLLAACGGKKEEGQSATVSEAVPEAEVSVFDEDIKDVAAPRFTILTQKKLPKKVDLTADISKCSLQELVLLRNYVYAVHGCYFIEAEIERFFEERTDWYQPMVEYMCEEENTVLDYKRTQLTKAERDFVDKIDVRIAEITKAAKQASGLMHPSAIKTLWQFEDIDPQFLGHLAAHNFVITPTQCEQLFNIYEENDYREVGSFVTTDLLLQLYHMYFVYAQKSLEKDVLRQRLSTLCSTMMSVCWPHDWDQYSFDGDQQLEELGRYAMAYFGVALQLLGEENGLVNMVPEGYVDAMQRELANIKAGEASMSPLLGWDVVFPYDMFKPRGYYDREEWSRTYFQTMQWLQLAGLNYNDEQSLRRAVFMASMLGVNADVIKAYEEVDAIISFITGEPDNISLLDIYNLLRSKELSLPQQAQSDKALAAVRQFITEKQNTRNRVKSKLGNPADSTLMFMPARYVPDNEVLVRMVDETKNASRPFPRALDVFSAFGVKQAEWLQREFYHDQREWKMWESELYGLQKNRKTWVKDNADKTVYNKWLATLFALQQSDKTQCPPFMKTQAWTLKDINTSLASWAELKHDAILYAEQPMLAECGGGGCLPPPYVKGYVEPNLPFWEALEELCELTHKKFKAADALTDDLGDKLRQIHNLAVFCRQVTEKELRGEELSEDEYWQITHIGSTVEWLSLSLVQPGVNLSFWNDVQGVDRSIACVADVFTRNVTGCNKCGIKHVGTGLAGAIYVMVQIGDYTYLTRGAVLDFREFVEPLNSRLTDEEWQKRLKHKPRYGEPSWMEKIKIDKQPRVDESIFYSSGC